MVTGAAHHLRTFLIPHAGNGYRPHLLHPKRAVGYAAFFAGMKIAVLALVVMIPSGIFATSLDGDAQTIMTRTNTHRTAARVATLRADPRLQKSAVAKAADMATREYFSHRTPDGRGPESFIAAAGYPYSVAGENLAMGFSDPDTVMRAWQASPSHARNLVDPDYADMGIGIRTGTFHGIATTFITQHFGRTVPTLVPAVVRPPIVDPTKTRVTWNVGKTGTNLTARVALSGSVHAATAEVQGQTIPLAPVAGSPGTFEGSAHVATTPAATFAVITSPTVTAEVADGTSTTSEIPWDAIPVVRPSLADRYARAVAYFPTTLGTLDTAAHAILFGALILFALAWLLNLFIEIRRQHIDLLVPSGALVLFLATLAFV